MHFQSALKILPWLLLPVIAMAANPPLGGSTTIGTGRLSLLTSQNLSTIDIKRAVYCTHGEPYIFTSSLNNTFPKTPPISQSFLASAGFTHNDDTYPFDCFIEVPGGVVVFEIKGEVDADGTIAFEVWLSVLVFNYEIGLYKCNLLDLEKDPCAFDIHKRYLDGQAGLFPQDDPSDPDMVDLCLVVLGTVKIPHTRVTKHIDFQKCFAKFPKTDPPSVSA